MQEDNYKDLHQDIISSSCVFEKAILQKYANCKHGRKHLLAEREAINCSQQDGYRLCKQFHDELKNHARFSLQQTTTTAPLAHNKEIQLQTGGLLGLQVVLENADLESLDYYMDDRQRFESDTYPVANINGLINQALTRFTEINQLPYRELVRAVSRSQKHKRGRRRGTD